MPKSYASMHSFGACRRNSGASLPQNRTWRKHLFLLFRYLALWLKVKDFSSACRKKCEERVATALTWRIAEVKPSLLRICGSTKVVHSLLFMRRTGTIRRGMPQPCSRRCGWAMFVGACPCVFRGDAVPVTAWVALAAVLVALARLSAAVNQTIAIDSRAACAFIQWGSDRKLSEVYEYPAQAALDFIAQGND